MFNTSPIQTLIPIKILKKWRIRVMPNFIWVYILQVWTFHFHKTFTKNCRWREVSFSVCIPTCGAYPGLSIGTRWREILCQTRKSLLLHKNSTRVGEVHGIWFLPVCWFLVICVHIFAIEVYYGILVVFQPAVPKMFWVRLFH